MTKSTGAAMGGRGPLLLAIVVILVVWQLPQGDWLLYPFTLLATAAHELGHGLTALLVGGQFDRLLLYADGSGMAVWAREPNRLAVALVAAGGLAGPSVAGAILFAGSRSARSVRVMLTLVAIFLATAVVLWARNPFGIGFLSLTALLLALAARYLPDFGARFFLQLLAVLLCLSWYRDLDYMFSSGAIVNGSRHPSDSAVIASALWLPYWFWGGLVAVASLGFLLGGLWAAGRPLAAAPPRG